MMARARTAAARILPDEQEKAQRVRAEYDRLMELFQDADINKKAFAEKHIQSLAWLNVSIADLQASIDEKGTSIPYQNGREQGGMQANPDCRILNDYMKHSAAAFRALITILPDKPISRRGKLADFFDCEDHDDDADPVPLDLDNV